MPDKDVIIYNIM